MVVRQSETLTATLPRWTPDSNYAVQRPKLKEIEQTCTATVEVAEAVILILLI